LRIPRFYSFLPGPLDPIARRTFAADCLRQLFVGVLDTGPKTFFLLIAVQRFSAADLHKTLITIPGAAGMALSVLLVPFLAGLSLTKPHVLAASRILSGFCFLAAAAFPTLESYVFWVFLGGLPTAVAYPLLTAVYHENYPRRIRGQLFAWAGMVNTASSILAHALIGAWLGPSSGNYRSVLAAFGLAGLLSAWSLLRMPSKPARPPAADTSGLDGAASTASPAHPGDRSRTALLFSALGWAWRDRTFGYMLLIWFVYGFGVWMITPLKVLFLTEPRYGHLYPAASVALIIGILPEATRFATAPLWAKVFDRYNFVGVRMLINTILLLALVAFFWGRTFPWLCVSAVLEGLVLAGGNIAWALWVTHVAPERHTAEYMAAHQFFTGIRGVLGAFLGIRLATLAGLDTVAWIAVSLVIVSILMTLPERRNRRWVRAEGGDETRR
jgi:MFS family permease